MFCPNCGTQAQNGTTFCSNCGTSLGQTQEPQQPQYSPPPGQPQYQQPNFSAPPMQQQYQQPQYQQPMEYKQIPADNGKVGIFGILYFLFPLVGVIMYFVWRKTKPIKAAKALKLALFGFIFGMATSFLWR